MSSLSALLQTSPAAEESSPWGAYVRVILLLAALLCFCYALLRLLGRRLDGIRNRGRGGAFELIDRLGLEPRRTLYIVRAGARYMALGASEAGIQLLMELSAENLARNAPAPEEERNPS